MKKCLIWVLLSFSLILTGCNEEKASDVIKFATSAEYPPFEYYEHGDIKGFDIELAQLIAKAMGKKAVLVNMQFSSILPALQNGTVDAAISTISITKERQKNFSFSNPYYTDTMAAVFRKDYPVTHQAQLVKTKVACQLGSVMEIWLKQHMPQTEIIAFNNNNQAIEALKAGHVNAVLMDGAQGVVFSSKHSNLSYVVIAQSDAGYGIAFKKDSALKNQVNQVLMTLAANGTIKKLEEKWFEGTAWKK